MKSVIGAIVGDIVGSIYEFSNHRSKDFELLSKETFFTDDSVLTLATIDILLNKKNPTKSIYKWARNYPFCSWGGSFLSWMYSQNPKPYNSFGNGAGMRISPVGWFANSEDEVKKISKEITETTHNHPEGIKGAEIVSMCVYYARIGKSKDFIKQYVEKYYDIDFDYETLQKTYRFNETCQETVPQAIYCFLISESFEDCLRTSVSIGGDTDTLCAISCGIAGAYFDIPENIYKKTLSKLEPKMIKLIQDFDNKIIKRGE